MIVVPVLVVAALLIGWVVYEIIGEFRRYNAMRARRIFTDTAFVSIKERMQGDGE